MDGLTVLTRTVLALRFPEQAGRKLTIEGIVPAALDDGLRVLQCSSVRLIRNQPRRAGALAAPLLALTGSQRVPADTSQIRLVPSSRPVPIHSPFAEKVRHV